MPDASGPPSSSRRPVCGSSHRPAPRRRTSSCGPRGGRVADRGRRRLGARRPGHHVLRGPPERGLRATVDAATLTFADTTVTAGSNYVYLVEAVGPEVRRSARRLTSRHRAHPRAAISSARRSPTTSMRVRRPTARCSSTGSTPTTTRTSPPTWCAGTTAPSPWSTPARCATWTAVVRPPRPSTPSKRSTSPACGPANRPPPRSSPRRRPLLPAVAAPGARSLTTTAFASALRRYPYLTDVVNSADATTGYATINWATDRSATTGAALGDRRRCGLVHALDHGDSHAHRAHGELGGGVPVEGQLTLLPDTQYCYRITLGSLDLLGSDASPRFWTQVPAGSSTPFSFAVFGDWGSVDSVRATPTRPTLDAADRRERRALRADHRRQRLLRPAARTTTATWSRPEPSISGVFGPQQLDRRRRDHPASSRRWATTASSAAMPRTRTSRTGRRTGPSASRTADTRRRPTAASTARRRRASRAPGTPSTPGAPASTCWRRPGPDTNGGSTTALRGRRRVPLDAASAGVPVAPERPGRPSGPAQVRVLPLPALLRPDATRTRTPSSRARASCEGLLSQYGVKLAFNGHAHIYQRNTRRLRRPGELHHGRRRREAAVGPRGSVPARRRVRHRLVQHQQRRQRLRRGLPAASNAQVFHFLKVTVDGPRSPYAHRLARPDLRRADLQRRWRAAAGLADPHRAGRSRAPRPSRRRR